MTEQEQTALLNEVLDGAPTTPEIQKVPPAADPLSPGASTTPALTDTGKIEKPAEVQEPEIDRDQSASVAVLLKRLHERERALAEREREIKDRDRQPEPRKWTRATQRARLSSYIKEELGLDPGEAARALMAETLGDAAPAEYRNIERRLRDGGALSEEIEAIRQENAELRGRLDDMSAEAATARYQTEYRQEVEAYVAGDLEKTHPNTARAFKTDRDWVLTEVQRIVGADARAKLALSQRDPSYQPTAMSPPEAFSFLEEHLAGVIRRLGSPAASQNVSAAAGTAPQSRKTMVSSTPTAPPVISVSEDEIEANTRAALHWLEHQAGA